MEKRQEQITKIVEKLYVLNYRLENPLLTEQRKREIKEQIEGIKFTVITLNIYSDVIREYQKKKESQEPLHEQFENVIIINKENYKVTTIHELYMDVNLIPLEDVETLNKLQELTCFSTLEYAAFERPYGGYHLLRIKDLQLFTDKYIL